MNQPQRSLISNYTHFHTSGAYGVGGKHLPTVLPHILELSPDSIVDYGAGRSLIAEAIARKAGIGRVARFEPSLPGLDRKPDGVFALLVSFDVLEHVPEEEMDSVLHEMSTMCKNALLIIDTRPAKALLADGRNAHVSLHDEAWWLKRLQQHFPSIQPIAARNGRVGFKTWPSRSTAMWRTYIEQRERALQKLGKLRAKLGRSRVVTQKS